MNQDFAPKSPLDVATQNHPVAAQPAARPREWAVTKEQLAAAERASQYHARRQFGFAVRTSNEHAA